MKFQSPDQTPTFATDPQAALASFWELGYHIEPNVWTQDQCENLIHHAQTLPTYQDETYAPVMQIHRVQGEFLTALRHPRIVKIAELLVSGKVSGLQSVFYFGCPGTVGFALHQDNFRLEAKRDACVVAWSALCDITPNMGGLVVYPGSHREPILPVERLDAPQDTGQDPNANCEQVIVPPEYEPFDLVVPAGAVVFMHNHLVHGSHKNRSDRFRYSLLTCYIRQGESFRPGNYAVRSEVNVY
ncbi:phytanoyl-CoA dioxygenase family protein [Kovacikia minuta CCNUW1]|uniref:phytanoyl-CoA dioxygenase family protein n=1 Tax=Kovacikia minuta TaxID=2931930 RepID=UPI001CCBAEC9|nr:phytanoyl-CoA dioxygenase family protein [Kovacikia minuta]UBF25410.1 phytanoyl-CoA dioxygenase family protein [Kovacikia minuta CCNUW1]